jgi:heat-inducible transcriptional repressor
MGNGIELPKRQQEILASVVRRYVSTGLPVGSKTVADELSESLSSATVRNVMAELEEAGFLEQPHVSAGRVPTDKAYRFYVDHAGRLGRLNPATAQYILDHLDGSEASPEELMAKTSRVLSEVSHYVGLVLGPALEEKLLEHLKLVALPGRRVLAVIVSRPDLIENKVIRLDEDVSQEELDRAAEYLSSEFRGWSLRTIRLEVFKRLEEMKTVPDKMLARVGMLFHAGALGSDESGPLFVDGTAKILDHPEFGGAHHAQELLASFEEKAKLVKILSACVESPAVGVRTVIGRENPHIEMQQCAFIVAPYRYRHRAVGALGVVGPMRMEYDSAITMVEYIAHLTSRLLSLN